MSPKGILRNSQTANYADLNDEETPLDRQTVLENTRANARLHSEKAVQLQSAFARDSKDESHLKWDEKNLLDTDEERRELNLGTMKITEPKTPFQGAVGDSEYYKDDDLDGDFSLGAPEVEMSRADPSVDAGRITVDEEARRADLEKEKLEKEKEIAEEEKALEEKHKKFDEMRKAHYFMKGAVVKHPMPAEEDDDDDEDEDDKEKTK